MWLPGIDSSTASFNCLGEKICIHLSRCFPKYSSNSPFCMAWPMVTLNSTLLEINICRRLCQSYFSNNGSACYFIFRRTVQLINTECTHPSNSLILQRQWNITKAGKSIFNQLQSRFHNLSAICFPKRYSFVFFSVHKQTYYEDQNNDFLSNTFHFLFPKYFQYSKLLALKNFFAITFTNCWQQTGFQVFCPSFLSKTAVDISRWPTSIREKWSIYISTN